MNCKEAMNYTGVVIKESLTDKRVIRRLHIVASTVEPAETQNALTETTDTPNHLELF